MTTPVDVTCLWSLGWHENTCWPGTHWMYYDERGRYAARVDLQKWNNGRYEWRVMPDAFPPGNDDLSGLENTLEEAKRAAEEIMAGVPHQATLF